MRKVMKKVLCMSLIGALILANSTTCLANNRYERSNRVSHIIDGYINSGYELIFEKRKGNKEHLSMTIKIANEEIVSDVYIEETPSGEIILNCFEGTKDDTVLIKPNGDIYANGAKVTVEETIDGISPNEIKGTSNTTYGRHYNVWTESCPYGTAADYSVIVGNTISKVLTFEQAIIDFTISALCGIIVGALLPSSVGGALVATGVSTLINYYRNNKPAARAMSCKRFQYIHNSKGEVINGVCIRKHVIRYYADKTYTTRVATSVLYNKILS